MQESLIWPVMWENDRPSEGGAAAIGQRGEASLRKATLEGPWLMSPMYWYNDLYTMHIYKYIYINIYNIYIIHYTLTKFWLLEFFISCHFFPQIGVDVLSNRAGLQSPHHEILAIQESAPRFFGSGRSQDPIHTFQQKLRREMIKGQWNRFYRVKTSGVQWDVPLLICAWKEFFKYSWKVVAHEYFGQWFKCARRSAACNIIYSLISSTASIEPIYKW